MSSSDSKYDQPGSNTTKEFNKELRELFKLISGLQSKFKNKLAIKSTENKMNSGIRHEPKYMITIMGPFLWSNREDIFAGKWKIFVERRYEMHLADLSKTHKFDYADSLKAVSFIKDAVKNASDINRTKVISSVKTLLGKYSEYLLQLKN
jgi:hypothetical protein